MKTAELESAVDAILARAGEHIVCGTPLGIGKPVPLLNALYARVKAQPKLRLSIITGLTLELPRAAGGLERRFLEPYVRRAFAGVPELDYMRDLRAGRLPPNVGLSEFYFRPGAMLGLPAAQQSYISSNYTHVARDMRSRGVNAVLLMVAERAGRYSLSSNPDLTLDVVRAMRAHGARGVVAGLVNRNLPFMLHDAAVGEDYFDVLVDAPRWEHPLFGVPNPPAEAADHAIGIHAAALVKDGGTLQLGIGALGDAVAYWLRVRHTDPSAFALALQALDVKHELVERSPFAEGLFASSEMFSWGLMTLYRAGVIRRRANGAEGPVLQAAFFLGPGEFYRTLRELPEDERGLFEMMSVARINDLYGDESVSRQQRRDARFINVCMKATLLGAAVSDGFDDGRVVSGVGGQFNFVIMAHELEGARSILLLRATHGSESNIVFRYGHQTIPRHLRDITITQYGIADLRGRTDAEVVAAMIAIAERRFQPQLAAQAKAAGKLPRDWRVPEHALGNTEQRLAERLAPLAKRGLLPLFPLGTDFDPEEQKLVAALLWVKRNTFKGLLGARPLPQDLPALARMGLAKPRGMRERLLRRTVSLGLQRAEKEASAP